MAKRRRVTELGNPTFPPGAFKQGKITRYIEHDGKIYLDPQYVDAFNELGTKGRALEDTVTAMLRAATKDKEQIIQDSRLLYLKVQEDIGLDLSTSWSWSPAGYLFRTPREIDEE